MPEGAKIDDRELVKIKSMISSMTEDERRHPERFVVTSWEEVVEGGNRQQEAQRLLRAGPDPPGGPRLRASGRTRSPTC